MKIVEVESESTQFKEDMKMQTKAFTEHVDRVGEQYSQIKKLKENIQENEVIVQMDLTEFTVFSIIRNYRMDCHRCLVPISSLYLI
jgi:hypothetical protein